MYTEIKKGQSCKFTGHPPKSIQEISIINRQMLKSLYETDDVLQLQCIGEVENINSMPTQVCVHSKRIQI